MSRYTVLHKVLVVLIYKMMNSNDCLVIFFKLVNTSLDNFALHCMWIENKASSLLFHVVLLAKHTEAKMHQIIKANQSVNLQDAAAGHISSPCLNQLGLSRHQSQVWNSHGLCE